MLGIVIDAHAVRVGDRFAISFQRTLRVPDDDHEYPLPPGLGVFPVRSVADFLHRAPPSWRARGGAFVALYRREALWLGFRAAPWKPNAVKIGLGGINAVSGEPFDEILRDNPQDYLVCPDQPWLDGINAGHGAVRQFVAVPLGSGRTVEAALTDHEEVGGIQILAFEPKPGRFPDEPPPQREAGPEKLSLGRGMGLGAGGAVRQRIYPDPYGLDTWDAGNHGRVHVHLLAAEDYPAVTGESPPPTPIDAAVYTEHGLPWFDLYDEDKGDVAPPDRLREVERIASKDEEAETPVDIGPDQVKILRGDNDRQGPRPSRERQK